MLSDILYRPYPAFKVMLVIPQSWLNFVSMFTYSVPSTHIIYFSSHYGEQTQISLNRIHAHAPTHTHSYVLLYFWGLFGDQELIPILNLIFPNLYPQL